MFDLLKLTLREKKLVALAFLCAIFVSLFTTLSVNLVQPIIDGINLPSDPAKANPSPAPTLEAAPPAAPGDSVPASPQTLIMNFLWKLTGIDPGNVKRALPIVVVIVFFGKGVFTFLSSFFMKAVGNKIVKKIRDELYAHILNQSASYFDRATTGDLMSRLTNDVDRIQQAVGTAMSDLVEETFILIGLLATLFLLDWKLALVSFVITPLAALPMAAFSRYLKKRGRQSQVKMAEIYNLIYETITGHKIVKAFGMEAFELRKFLKATWRYFRINLKLAWISAFSSPFMEFLGAVVGAFILFVGSQRIGEGHLSPGGFVAFAAAIFLMFQPIKRLNRANNVVQQAAACYDRIREILDVRPDIQDNPGAVPLPPVQGRVRFENVGFSYNADRPVLFDVSFETQPRETVALVGLSGAGKTTIVNLLARFYEPTSGRITVDGRDIRDVTLASLRAQIGLVTQDIVLFNDTVRANIAYGLDDVPLDRIIDAAKAAECHAFIMDLPKGYDATVGERGSLLSVGQRQRLALARALLKNPPILILDEATSALDSESERLIQQALANIMKDRTTFVIAHRLSTIRSASSILVVDGGRIVESGPHETLIRRRGIYRKLHDLQFPEAEETEP